jgi:hypothetical protein
MNFAMACIDHEPLKVWLNNEPLQQALPNTTVSPSAKPTMRVFPVTVARRQVAPRRSAAQYPKYRIDEASVIPSNTSPLPALPRQMRFNQRPVDIANVVSVLCVAQSSFVQSR